MSCLHVQGIAWSSLIKQTFQAFARDRMQTYAAALAFRTVFAMFPFLVFLLAILGFLGVPEFFGWLREQAELALPGPIVEQLDPVIDELSTRRGGVLVLGVLVGLWTASLAVRDLMYAMNNVYNVEESRSTARMIGIMVGTTLAIALLLVAAAAFMFLGPEATRWLAAKLEIGEQLTWVWGWIRWPVVVLLLLLLVGLLYYVTPAVQQKFRFVSLGSLMAVPAWIAASIGFSLYMRNFADYGALYGGLGAIIMLLLYFYVSAMVLLLGAEANAVIERAAEQGRDDGSKSIAS